MFRWLIRDWVWLVLLIALGAMAVRHELAISRLHHHVAVVEGKTGNRIFYVFQDGCDLSALSEIVDRYSK